MASLLTTWLRAELLELEGTSPSTLLEAEQESDLGPSPVPFDELREDSEKIFFVSIRKRVAIFMREIQKPTGTEPAVQAASFHATDRLSLLSRQM